MEQINNAAAYYQLLIDKFEKTGQSPNQLRIFKEIKELVLGCSTYEEIQTKMKNGGYYISPAQAMFMDKMQALKKAAEHNRFPELAKIYQDKYNEVSENSNAMYDIGYSQLVSEFYLRKSNILNAFYEIFLNFLTHKNANIYDLNYKSSLNNIRENQKKLQALNTDFTLVAQDPYFRNHIGLDDPAYARYVDEVLILFQKYEVDPSEESAIKALADEAWSVLQSKKAEIQEIGKREEERIKRSVFIAVPPKDINGKFEFLFNEQEEF
jgi:hypothetical protein